MIHESKGKLVILAIDNHIQLSTCTINSIATNIFSSLSTELLELMLRIFGNVIDELRTLKNFNKLSKDKRI
jgi:hypothetical protein